MENKLDNNLDDEISNEELILARERIAKKMMGKCTKVGGARRKKKSNFIHILGNGTQTQDERNIFMFITKINDYLARVENQEELDSISVFVDDTIYFYLSDLSKNEVKKKQYLKKIKEEPNEFFNEYFFENRVGDEGQCIGRFSSDIFTILKQLFNNDGISYLADMYKNIYHCLESKTYLENKEALNTDELNINDCHELLNIDKNEIPTKKELILAFRKKALMMHPDKHPKEKEKYEDIFMNINKAYQFLLKHYKL